MALFGRGGKKEATQPEATPPVAAKPKAEAKPVDFKATKGAITELRAEVNALLKEAKQPATQETAAVKADALEGKADALIATADANLKQANANKATKGAGKKEGHEVGVAKGQKVDALRVKADAVKAQIPAAEAKAETAFAAKKADIDKADLKGKAKQTKLTAAKKEAFKEVKALEREEGTLRSQARKIETEAKKSSGKDEAAAFKAEVRDTLKEIKGLLIDGNGSLTQQIETAAKVEAAAKGKLGRDLTPTEQGVVAARARFAPKGSHAATVAESKGGVEIAR